MATIKLRRGSTSQWETADPILAYGEPGVEFAAESVKWKVGDGVTAWTALAYAGGEVVAGILEALADETNAPLIAAALLDPLAALDEATRLGFVAQLLASVAPGAVIVMNGDATAVEGMPLVPLSGMTFGDRGLGTVGAFADAASLATLTNPTTVEVVAGVAQILWDDSTASLRRVVNVSGATEIRIAQLGDLTKFRGERLRITFVNDGGGTHTITRGAGVGDAPLIPDSFTLAALGTADGDRVIADVDIDYDGSMLWKDSQSYAAASIIVPSYVGSSSYSFGTGGPASNYELVLHPDCQVGDVAIITVPQTAISNTLIDYGDSPGETVLENITRLNSSVGSNYGVALYAYALTADDITAGNIVIPVITNLTSVSADFFRNVNKVTHAAGYTRSTGLNANSIVLESETSTEPSSIALAIVVRGGGLRTPTVPAGWSQRTYANDGSASAGRIVIHTMTQTLGEPAATPADTFSVSGAADLCLTTATVVLEWEAA
jgi:hypothetical protein